MRYAIKYPQFNENDIINNCIKLQQMKTVKELTGEEFPKSEIPLQKRILSYFDSLGNNVYSEQFGDVALNNSSVHDDLGHGKTNRKITAFAAIPEVIKEGVEIDVQRRGNGNYDRLIVAAPITIDADEYAMGVMLQRDHQSQRLVLHDVVVINKKETTSSLETTPSTTEVSKNNDSLYMTTILQRALAVKELYAGKQKIFHHTRNTA